MYIETLWSSVVYSSDLVGDLHYTISIINVGKSHTHCTSLYISCILHISLTWGYACTWPFNTALLTWQSLFRLKFYKYWAICPVAIPSTKHSWVILSWHILHCNPCCSDCSCCSGVAQFTPDTVRRCSSGVEHRLLWEWKLYSILCGNTPQKSFQ
jgi:hypothetical protein